MLKLISSSAFRQIYPTHLASPLRAATESLSSISGMASRGSLFCQKAFFCSKADHGLTDHSTVLVVPRPDTDRAFLFPLLKEYISVGDTSFYEIIGRYESRKAAGEVPYACVSLLKDCHGAGKGIFDRLHKVGTLAKIDNVPRLVRGPSLHLYGLRRVRITEMVSEDPLMVKVDHLKDLPFNKDDPTIKATFSAVKSGLIHFFNSKGRSYLCQLVKDLNCQELSSFGAGLLAANKYECQAFLEELDVHKRLEQALKFLHNRVQK